MADPSIPPIFRDLRGLRVIDVGSTKDGYPFIRLAASTQSRVRDIIVWVVADQPSTFRYAYTYVDPDTKVLVSKRGVWGDPEKDDDGEWLALE